jgi:hypothetical protein
VKIEKVFEKFAIRKSEKPIPREALAVLWQGL